MLYLLTPIYEYLYLKYLPINLCIGLQCWVFLKRHVVWIFWVTQNKLKLALYYGIYSDNCGIAELYNIDILQTTNFVVCIIFGWNHSCSQTLYLTFFHKQHLPRNIILTSFYNQRFLGKHNNRQYDFLFKLKLIIK